MTSREFETLWKAGILGDAKVELIDGRVVMGSYEFVFAPEQARAAAALGIPVHCCVDAVLEDEPCRTEVVRRLKQHFAQELSSPPSDSRGASGDEPGHRGRP